MASCCRVAVFEAFGSRRVRPDAQQRLAGAQRVPVTRRKEKSMRGRLKRYVLAIGLALVLPLLALATWKFQKIDNPMYFRTLPNGINDAGWVVGTESTLDEKF